jgi:hypothetical protein
MRATAALIAVLLVSLLGTIPLFGFGSIPVRGSSRNGTDDIAQLWNLFGPTGMLTLTNGTKKVTYKQQVVCPSQDVTNASDPTNTLHTGTCESGAYLFIFQLRSSSSNVTVTLGNLNGFVPDPNSPSYGVLLCDSPDNTLELCTTATQAQLPNITFSSNQTHTTASFVIPNFPAFPVGKVHQGQGITLFLLTQQAGPNPVFLPTIAIQ